jgi:hypothetical protein
VRTTAAAVLAFVGLLPPAAWAVDWSIRSTASETADLSDNLFLSPHPIGGTLGSYSTITSNAEARTPTSRFNFDSNVNYTKYLGPGATGLPQTEALSFGFRGHYETFGKNNSDRNYVDASFNQSSAAFALLNQLGVLTNAAGALNTLNFAGGFDRSLSALDTITVSARSTLTSFDPSSAGTAFTDTSVHGSWSHRLSPLTTLVASSDAERLDYNNAFGSSLVILRNQGGFDTSLTPLLSFRGNWGAAYIQSNNGAAAGSSTVTGLIYDMLLTYRALKNTTFTLSAFQSVGPSVLGSLFESRSVQAGVSQAINSASSLSFSAGLFDTISTTSSQFASASVSYTRFLAPDWTAALSYRHLHNLGTTGGTPVFTPIAGIPVIPLVGAASSNTITVVLSKSTTWLAHTD